MCGLSREYEVGGNGGVCAMFIDDGLHTAEDPEKKRALDSCPTRFEVFKGHREAQKSHCPCYLLTNLPTKEGSSWRKAVDQMVGNT